MKRLQKTLYVAAAFCWLLFGAGFGLFLVQFLLGGAGMQLFGDTLEFIMPVSPQSVLTGLIYVTGFGTAALVCLAVSFGLFERALTTGKSYEEDGDAR
jgi:hypothetical protein